MMTTDDNNNNNNNAEENIGTLESRINGWMENII